MKQMLDLVRQSMKKWKNKITKTSYEKIPMPEKSNSITISGFNTDFIGTSKEKSQSQIW